MNPPITDMAALGRQLRCPEGALAQEVADYIFASNEYMIRQTIDRLFLTSGERILEVGFGNGGHLPYLFAQGDNLHYTGIERSEEMLLRAREQYMPLIEQGKAVFLKAIEGKPPRLPEEAFEVFFRSIRIILSKTSGGTLRGSILCLPVEEGLPWGI